LLGVTAETVAAQITAALPHLRRGTLRMFGDWFGRPYDNIHTVVGAEADGELLRVEFDEHETLSVWNPEDAVISEDVFRIGRASRVRWEWFYYGRPQTSENLYAVDYVVENESISVSDTADWYEPQHDPDLSAPAVELV
jgi:hypothetical protein